MSYICVMLGVLGASSVFHVCYIMTVETFPTSFRGAMMGISNASARIGGITAPYILSVVSSLFMYILGALMIASGLLSFLLRETKGAVMSDTAADLPFNIDSSALQTQ